MTTRPPRTKYSPYDWIVLGIVAVMVFAAVLVGLYQWA